jgi:hypothetical protein
MRVSRGQLQARPMKILIVRGCAMDRALPLIAGAVFTAAIFVMTPAFAQSTGEGLVPPADLHPPINLDSDTLRARFGSSNLGLKPSNVSGAASALPYGIDYNRETRSLVVPLDRKNDWGVGVGLNMNTSSRIIELSPSGVLGLQQPNRAPGLMLHGKF